MKTVICMSLLCVLASAQDTAVAVTKGTFTFTTDNFRTFVMAEGRTKTVTGAPYTAQAITESTQVLADGNRISRKNTASFARDSEGRTRNEQKLSFVGPWPTEGKDSTVITINDPVAKANYILQPNDRTAVKSAFGETAEPALQVREMKERTAKLLAEKKAIDGGLSAQPSVKTESLGSQSFDGVMAEGKRVTETIAAGAIGNEKPIDIVNETWFSQDLQTVVMSKHSDPRTGDTVYQLTNIQRGEPSPTLFQVPSDYNVREEIHMMVKPRHVEE
ncbi:MAG TPA: hypothetical protein VKU01_31935 [Bryobacteraceae bacterium]|nr:hypothetical protein [Bryobacteraceae bacterium]